MFLRRTVFSISVVCCLLLLVLLLSPTSAFANSIHWQLNGKYWPNNFSIRYAKESMSSKGSSAFSAGVNAWNVSPAPVLFTGGGNGNYIDLYERNDGASGYDGMSYEYTGTSGCNTSGTTVYIITGAGAYLNTYYTNGYGSGEVQSVAAHELGHTIGLEHDANPSVPSALMYYSTSRYTNYGTNTPQSDDIAGAQAIYNTCK